MWKSGLPLRRNVENRPLDPIAPVLLAEECPRSPAIEAQVQREFLLASYCSFLYQPKGIGPKASASKVFLYLNDCIPSLRRVIQKDFL